MHEAERYHKSGPPLLARYLPFWAATRGLRVPLGYADAHYRLRMHVDLLRRRVQEMALTATSATARSTTSWARRRTSRSGPHRAQAAGLMFWFAVKRLVGSYFCFSAASRS